MFPDHDHTHFDHCVLRVERMDGGRVATSLRGDGRVIATARRERRLFARAAYWTLTALVGIGVVVFIVWLMMKLPEKFHSTVAPAVTGFSLLMIVGLALRFAPFRPVQLSFPTSDEGFELVLFGKFLTHTTYRVIESTGETRGYIMRRGLLGQEYCFAEDLDGSVVELAPRAKETGAVSRSLLHQAGLMSAESALGKQADGWDIVLASGTGQQSDHETAELGWIKPVHADLGQFELMIDRDETLEADRGLLCATVLLALLEGVKPAKSAKDYPRKSGERR